MSATGLKVFDTTIQAANIWLDDVRRELGWSGRHKAFHALRSVLQTLRDRLSVDESAQLSAQLPLLIRGVFFEGWARDLRGIHFCISKGEAERLEHLLPAEIRDLLPA